jgi:O-antigen/teichoic acid export membrane protein
MLLLLVGFTIYSHSFGNPVYAQLGGWTFTAVIGVWIMDKTFKNRMLPEGYVHFTSIKSILSVSLPMLMAASMQFFLAQTGLLILGMYRPTSEVGYYAIAVKLATLTTFVLQSINSMAAPKYSELFHTGRIEELVYIAKKSTRYIFWATTPILLTLVTLGPFFLSLFGKGFSTAYLPMLILILGQFVNSISGSTAYFLNMTGHQKAFKNIITVSSILSLVLNFLLIPNFGLYGAAIAGALSHALWNAWTLFYIKVKFGDTIGYFPFLGLNIRKGTGKNTTE